MLSTIFKSQSTHHPNNNKTLCGPTHQTSRLVDSSPVWRQVWKWRWKSQMCSYSKRLWMTDVYVCLHTAWRVVIPALLQFGAWRPKTHNGRPALQIRGAGLKDWHLLGVESLNKKKLHYGNYRTFGAWPKQGLVNPLSLWVLIWCWVCGSHKYPKK